MQITIHTPKPLSGQWIDSLLASIPNLQIEIINKEILDQCNYISHYAHKSDYLRLYFIYKMGGIYSDIDVFPYKSIRGLLKSTLPILGEQRERGLCNAVILAPTEAGFIKKWLSSYTSFNNTEWDYHSVILPAILAAENPEEVVTLPASAFFEPQWHNQLQEILDAGMQFEGNGYCCHLWHTICKQVLQDISPEFILETPCFYSNVVRKVVNQKQLLTWKKMS